MRHMLPVLLLLAGCGDLEDNLHAPSTELDARVAAYAAARALGEAVMPTHTVGASNGGFIPDKAVLVLTDDWDRTAIGQFIVFNRAGPVFHKIVGGTRERGWITKGIANTQTDDGIVTEANYVATYHGYILHR